MKKVFSFVLVLLIKTTFSFGQSNSIPNAGFEEWTGTSEVPVDWGVINFSFLTFIDFNSATKSTDMHSGDYALQLESKSFSLPAPLPPLPIPPLPGAAAAGNSTTTINALTRVPTNAGFAFSGHPTVLKGYYKYFPAGIDTASIVVTLTHWNFDTGKRDTITSGVKYLKSTVASYTLFSVLIDSYTDMPDTAMISIFSSPAGNPKDGSKLMIDDLEFYPNIYAGVSENKNQNEGIKLFPNPSRGKLFINTEAISETSLIKIFDLCGKEMYSSIATGKQLVINTSFLESGMYLCSGFDKQGNRISTKLFTINN